MNRYCASIIVEYVCVLTVVANRQCLLRCSCLIECSTNLSTHGTGELLFRFLLLSVNKLTVNIKQNKHITYEHSV